MQVYSIDSTKEKGWYCGPWNTDLQVAIGFATRGVDEPHMHLQIQEIYLVAAGSAQIRVEQQTLVLSPGDVLSIEPGIPHTFLSSSPDYLHFVIHLPAPQGKEAGQEKVLVPRARLGL